MLCDNLPIKISLIFNLILPSAHSEKVIPLSHPEHGSQARHWMSRLPFGGKVELKPIRLNKPRVLYLLMKMLRQWGKKSKDLRKDISSKMGYIFIGTLFLFGFLIQFILFKPLISVKAIEVTKDTIECGYK